MAASPTSALAPGGVDLDALRVRATADPKSAVKAASRQFEAMFMAELLKSMRASVGPGMFDNAGSEMGTQMLDAQYANSLSGQPGGLADMLAKQLERQMGGAAASSAAAGDAKAGANAGAIAPKAGAAAAPNHIPQKAYAEDFVRKHSAAAEAASRETGIPAAFILAQAAHETGWGRKEILNADGSPSHNVFGMKATSGWQGATATITTTEYRGGHAHKVQDTFKSYASYEEAFTDWARTLKNSPRYAAVVAGASSAGNTAQAAQAFASGLQRAGYATDPAYGDKLGRMINTTLRLQRASVA